jgi:phenylalanyl-tRNA synthetase beta chain
MKISCRWLRDYVKFGGSAEELSDRLTGIGFEVESMERIGPSFSGVLVGKVLSVSPHPKADKLKICEVTTGREILSVVCGASNVQAGQTVPFAEKGAVLADGTVLESKSIRGVPSAGMICSARELGLGVDHSGILVLDPARYAVGDIFSDDSSPSDAILELNVSPNRPDCLSHFGIAREIGVVFREKAVFPAFALVEKGPPAAGRISVRVENPEKCLRYSARLLTDVRIGPSPKWLSERLEAVGMRSINNIVDITNYVMLETGQPLHAFDFELLSGRQIRVRCAADGEEFVTLDGRKQLLSGEDLLICDGDRGVALAGVMGGLNSEVNENTRHVLLESACFHPMTVRKTAKRLGFSTEASVRFERGTDPNMTLWALDRASQLLVEHAGAIAAEGALDAYPRAVSASEIILEKPKVTRLLGLEIPDDAIVSIFEALGLVVLSRNPYRISIPTYRMDLRRDVDLIEEIIRHYGFEKIEPRLRSGIELSGERNAEQEFCELARDILAGFGFFEVLNNSLVSPKHISAMAKNRAAVSVQNPLSPDNGFLRTDLIPGLLDSVVWNRNRSQSNLKLFEIGRIFRSTAALLPEEIPCLSGVLTGLRQSRPYWGEKSVQTDFFDLKGFIQAFLNRLHVIPLDFREGPSAGLQPDTAVTVFCRDLEIGFFGELDRSVLMPWDIDTPVFAFEFDIPRLLQVLPVSRRYESIPRFPAVCRDLAFVVDETVPAAALLKSIRETGGENLHTVELFDLYRGPQVGAGKKSAAFSLQFISGDRTLKEEEIEPAIRKIIQNVQTQFSASLRT